MLNRLKKLVYNLLIIVLHTTLLDTRQEDMSNSLVRYVDPLPTFTFPLLPTRSPLATTSAYRWMMRAAISRRKAIEEELA